MKDGFIEEYKFIFQIEEVGNKENGDVGLIEVVVVGCKCKKRWDVVIIDVEVVLVVVEFKKCLCWDQVFFVFVFGVDGIVVEVKKKLRWD